MTSTLIVSASAETRLFEARRRLDARDAAEDVLVLGQTLAAPHDLLLAAAVARGPLMGWRRTTLDLLAVELAAPRLARSGRAPGLGSTRDAIVARALGPLGPAALGRLALVADTPGFVRSVGAALEDLAMAGIGSQALAVYDPELARSLAAVDAEWEAAGLASRARVHEAATEAAADPGFRHFWLDLPLVVLDVRVRTIAEADLIAALAARAPEAWITVPAGDVRTLGLLGRRGLAPGAPEGSADPAPGSAAAGDTALARVRTRLFRSTDGVSEPAPEDGTLTIFSAPGESRECVEIARRLADLAAGGTAFDRAAILLRQPADYRPHLEEALGRAGIPAWFAAGVRRPDPAGRAFLALLRCRAEDYSARRFAEYLSIGQVPPLAGDGAPPPERDGETRWVSAEETAAARDPEAELAPGDAGAPEGHVRVPRRWERLLVEAAVVGGLERWEARLNGLAAELELELAGLETEDADAPRGRALRRDRDDLAHFRHYALPLLGDLAALPDTASWAEWLDRLGALATRALARPGRVLALLEGLAPMKPIGPVALAEVLRVLGPRLLEVTERPSGSRFGRVFVGAVDEARGLAFDVVFVPGLAERVFPPKIAEDPILLDHVRECLNEDARAGRGSGEAPADRHAAPLETNEDRVAGERLALRLAVGAARRGVVLSYPRIETGKARPRVPSFYALEAVRAAEGALPPFEALGKRAEQVSDARIGWPAPRAAERAIDEAEYDLAVLDDLGLRGEPAVRAAGHLLNTNPHLARALRFRAYRWAVPKWTGADGLVNPSEAARAALAAHAPGERPFSATALQHYAACPYRFFLYAIQRLEPRREPESIEELDPLQRGSLVHQVQFELLTRLQEEHTPESPRLPVRPATLDAARATLDEVLVRVAAEFAERLVPAIARVWTDGIEAIRQDLREWLHRESLSESPFEPWRFELSFGLPRDPNRDERSVRAPVELGNGLRLRGAIDLVEKTPSGVLRVTDHKTGRARAKRNAVVQGGEILQPVLYALAARRLFPELRVDSGRLYYCTSDGGFETHEVPLDAGAEDAAGTLARTLEWSFEEGLLPAAPRPDACRWCDYLSVCGPDEERRTRRKPPLAPLRTLRDLP